MNVQTLWLKVLRNGVDLDVVVDLPVVGVDGPHRLGRMAERTRLRPLPRAMRQGDEVNVPRRESSETFL